MVSRDGQCLEGGLGEIAGPVKMRVSRRRTKRPRGALLQLDVEGGPGMRRIGGRLGSWVSGLGGAALEIPLFLGLPPNSALAEDSVWWAV